LIRRHFGVSFNPDHVRRFLRARLGWTSHKPQRPRARRGRDRPLAARGVPAHRPAGAATRRPPGVAGRVGLPADPQRPPHAGATRPDAGAGRLGPPRPPLGHQWRDGQPAAAAEPVPPPAAQERCFAEASCGGDRSPRAPAEPKRHERSDRSEQTPTPRTPDRSQLLLARPQFVGQFVQAPALLPRLALALGQRGG
jgi:hypothetical protein